VSISFNRPLATSDATVPSLTQALTPTEEAIQRGFSDGFMTAKLFAQQSPGMSRLGFKTQYVQDSLDVHGPNVILPGKEEFYREWFDKGLAHGEGLVQKVVARMNTI
jgi:glucan 1,3-beta-glucosidase